MGAIEECAGGTPEGLALVRYLLKPLHGIVGEIVFLRMVQYVLGEFSEDRLEGSAIGFRSHCGGR